MHGTICRMNEEAHIWYTQSTLGDWERKKEVLAKEIRKLFAGEGTLAINLGLWIAFGCVEFKAGGTSFMSEVLKGQRRELSPGQLPFSSLSQQEAAGNEKFSI